MPKADCTEKDVLRELKKAAVELKVLATDLEFIDDINSVQEILDKIKKKTGRVEKDFIKQFSRLSAKQKNGDCNGNLVVDGATTARKQVDTNEGSQSNHSNETQSENTNEDAQSSPTNEEIPNGLPSEEILKDQTSEEVSGDQTSEKVPMDQTSEEVSKDQSSEENPADQTSEEVSEHQTSEENLEDQASGENLEDRASEGILEDQTSEEIQSTQNSVAETQNDQTIEEIQNDQSLEENQNNETSNELQNEQTDEDSQNDVCEETGGDTEKPKTGNDDCDDKSTIGKIKLVCLSKLIDPDLMKTRNDKAQDVSVVTISDSDSDSPITLRKLLGKQGPSKPAVRNEKSDSTRRKRNGDDNSKKTKKKVEEGKDKTRNPTDEEILLKLRDSGSESGNTEQQTLSGANKKKTKKAKPVQKTCSNSYDKKFYWKCHVTLPRVSGELLKKRYMRKMEKLAIKRLANMKTLKNAKRSRAESSASDSTSTKQSSKRKKVEKAKAKHKRASKEESRKSSSSGSANGDSSDSDAHPNEKSKNDHRDTPDKNPESSEKVKDALDQSILEEICDDGGDAASKGGSSDDSSEDDKKKSKKGSKGEKESKKKEKEKTKKDDSSSESSNDSEEQLKKGDLRWRKDKLLTDKLSDTDSSDFAALKKKRAKKAEENARSKRKKRIRVDSDSDASKAESEKSESSDEKSEESEVEKKSSKRKRIKRVKESSSDDEDKSTRKHIRKVIGRDSLAETTKQAERDESERKARIADKQKKYNNIFEADKLEKSTLAKVVLDFNENTEEELLAVDEDIVKHLKPHQGKGIQFMWDACFESLDRAKNTGGSGCILAHCMGLGKTLQVIAFIHTLLADTEKTGVKTVLVVCPLSTVLNWVAEFKKWLPEDDDTVEVFDLVAYKRNTERSMQCREWHRCGGVLVIGYDMYRNLSNQATKRNMSKKLREDFQRTLVDPGPDLVICDEGHLLKNEKTALSISMNRIKSARRIVLTGTPLQNNLREYWCMVQFVKPNLLGTYKEYINRFVNPITNGQYTDSTQHDINIMRKRSHVLHKLLDGIVQRRDYGVLAPFLPPKYEYVIMVRLTETQEKMYMHYMRDFAKKSNKSKRTSYLFIDFQELQRICTHPRVLLDKSIKSRLEQEKRDWENEEEESEGSLKDFIDDTTESDSSSSSSSSGSGSDSDNSGGSGKKKKKKKEASKKKYTKRTRAMAAKETDDTKEASESEVEEILSEPTEWWRQYTTGDELDNITYSGKLSLLFEILHQCEIIGDKLLVFSQSLFSLNIIEYFLRKVDEATQNGDADKNSTYSGSWALGLDYFRLDGSSSCDNRASWCTTFNDPENTRARLFLISTRAGGLGINLVAANRVIIFDVSWNPSHDVQSIYRVYRFGQTKPSYIYRFVSMGTMEMKVYERQVTKQAISKRVIDEQQIDRHYNQNDLAELYKFEPVTDEDRPIPLVPKDILLGELLQSHEKLIYQYHEHQSLLENKEDEMLDEEERKAAWEEFENEKKLRQNFSNTNAVGTTINQIPVSAILAALTSIMKREQPSFTPAEINGVMPQLVAELRSQLAIGDQHMYNKVLNEIRQMQAQAQMRQMQFQMMLAQMNSRGGVAPDNVMAAQRMYNYNPQNFPAARPRPANPNDVVSLDD